MNHWKRLLCGILLAGLGLQLAACGTVPAAEESQPREETAQVPVSVSDAEAAIAAADFSVALLRNTEIGEQTCILSPYSVLIAMAMTANGADGETLAQMEAAFGMPMEDLNRWLSSVCESSGKELISANSVWLNQTDGFALSPEYAELIESKFKAEAISAAFDAQTVEQINLWVSERTSGRIPSILNSLSPDAMMVLVNALTFDAAWKEIYPENKLREGIFTAADGTEQTVTMMSSKEGFFLDDGKATGFLKSYENDRYQYAALLPNEEVPMQEYLASLSGKGLLDLLHCASQEPVQTQMPAYQAETFADMGQTLQKLGISDAFSGQADFSRMGNSPLNISEVLHKTYMKVFAGGTEAAAATAVVMTKSARPMRESRSVILDRPYVMAIFDRQTDTILFLGVVNSVDKAE